MKRKKDTSNPTGWRIETTWKEFLAWIETKCPSNLRWVYKNAIKEYKKTGRMSFYDNKNRPIYFIKA